MSCQETFICQAGKTYSVRYTYSRSGTIAVMSAINPLTGAVFDPRSLGAFQWGECGVSEKNDVFRVVQSLSPGANTITHNLGFLPSEVEVRNNSTGAQLSVRITNETSTAVTIFVPVAVVARITIDV